MGNGRRRRAHDGATFLESVRCRLDRLETVLMDLHWVTVGQWRHQEWESDSTNQLQLFQSFDQTPTGMPESQKASFTDEFIPTMKESVSSLYGIEHSCANACLQASCQPKHLELVREVPVDLSYDVDAAKDKAAIVIQRMFRAYISGDQALCVEERSHTESDEYDKQCVACGIDFMQPSSSQDYDGDRCDICAAPHHPECMLVHVDLSGEWSLCASCLALRLKGHGLACDFRAAPTSFWNLLYNKFKHINSSETRADSDAGLARSDVEDLVRQRKTLDTHLEYMVRYLEMTQGTSTVPDVVRNDILKVIQEACAWKKSPRSAEDVSAKITELGSFITETVSSLK